MTRYASALTIALTVACCLSASAAPIERSTLDNGLTVLAVENDSTPVAGIALLVKASALDEGRYGIGTRMVLQQIILSAAHEQLEGLTEVASAYANRQPRFGVHTDYEVVETRLSVEVSELEAALARMRGLVFAPEVTEAALKSARELAHQGYDATHRSPVQTTYELFREAFYATGPLAGPMEGNHEDLDQVTLESLLDLHGEQYVAANTVLAVVAPLPTAEIAAVVATAFGDLPDRPPVADVAPPAAPTDSAVEVTGTADVAQASMVVGVPVPGPAAEDHLVGKLMAQLLDGPEGRLRRDRALLQTLGLVIPSRVLAKHYPIRALPVPLTRSPYLAVHVLCAPGTIEHTRRGILRHFMSFRTGSASDTELALARKRVINEHGLERLRPADAAVQLAQREAMGMALLTDAEFAAAVDAIAKEDLTAFALKHFDRHAVGLQMPTL